MKKTISLFLVLVLLIAIMPMAFAASAIVIEGEKPHIAYVGENFSLTAQPDPQAVKDVTWSSSDTSVATVNESTGVVTPVAVGSSVITVNAEVGGAAAQDTVSVEVRNVKMSQKNATISVGQTLTLTATAEPANKVSNVTWSSSNETVAIVTGGTVTAKAVGNATITALVTFTDEKTKTCTCALNVEMVKALTIDKTTLTVGVGEKLPVVVTAVPAATTADPAGTTELTYGFDNSNASFTATATGANIKGNSVGTSKLTVTAKYSDNTYKTVTCDVTVVVKVNSVTLNKSTTSIENGKTEKLVATVNPAAATDQTVTWSSSNTAVATVASDGTVTGVAAGSAKITATSNADNTKSASCTVTVTKVPLTSVAINKTNATVSPNATEQLSLTNNPTNATVKTVTWASQNAAVATVDSNGLVTGKGAGTTTVTATVVDDLDNTKTASCVITVPEVKCVVTMGKYYGGNLGRAYYSYDGYTWYEVTTTTGQSVSVTNGTVVYFKMDPYSGYYRHPYVVNANGSYYAPYMTNGTFSVAVTENKVIKLNFSKAVPTGDASMWQYVVAAFASAGTATGIVISTKRKK